MNYLKVKNWEDFQHYKDRDPKWIKLYRSLLDNYEYSLLSDAEKSHIIGIWLLAAKMGNKIPADPKWIQARIGATTKINIEKLKTLNFIELYQTIQNDTEEKAGCINLVRRERGRVEGEAEKEKERERRKFTPPNSAEVEEYGKSIKYKIDGESFVAFYASKGWKVGNTPMKDWRSAVVTWKKRDMKEHPQARKTYL